MKKESSMDAGQKELTDSLLDAFDSLKSPAIDVKVTGGCKVIARLQHKKNDKDIQYTLKRLIRSLGANIPEARMGYFATLVGLLSHTEDISVTNILDFVKKELHASGSSSKSEVGDVNLGQILVCGAIFRSGLINKCTIDEKKEVVQLLQTASTKKAYLSTVAHLILLDLVNGLDEDQFAKFVWPILKPDFKKEIKEYSLDSLYSLMVIKSKFPNKINLQKLIGAPTLFQEETIPTLCEKLMSGIDFNSSNHPVYIEIGKEIAKSPHLLLFWKNIDGFLVKHNRNRELAVINILKTIFMNLDDNVDVIPELLSGNFFKLFMDWFKGLQTASKIRNKKDQEDDHKIMVKKEKEFLVSLSQSLKHKSVTNKLRVSLLKKLLLNPGELNFTELTGSTVIRSTIADLDAESLKKLAKVFKKVLLNKSKKVVKEDVERNWYNNERVKAAEHLSYIVSHEAVKDDTDFKINCMQLLMCFGFLKIGGDENVAVSNELSGAIKACFYRCFTSRFSNVDNLMTVLSSLCNFISNIMKKDQVNSKLEKQFSKENMECWDQHMDVCQQIEKIDSKSKVDKVFIILLHQLGLFLFSEPAHVNVSKSSITELKSCYEHYNKGINKKSKKLSSENEPEWVEVMVEVLLSILSIESSVLRSVVQCVFRLLWEFLTPSCINQIISVLDPESEANPLNEDSESDEDDEGETDTNNVDTNNTNNVQETENTEITEDDSEDSDNVSESDDDDLKTPDQLRMAVQKALGSAVAPDTDTESIDADMIDEEEGKKLDEALAEAFKQFHQSKNKKSKKDRKNKKALSDFRIRVLDLIDIYLEKDPAMDICISMIPPLTRCLEFCMQDNQFTELENKIRKIFKTLVKIRKFSSTGDVTIDVLTNFLKEIIGKHNRSHFVYQALGDVVTYSAIFIIHCSQRIEFSLQGSPKKRTLSPISEVLKEAIESYFQSRNNSVPIIFFHRVLQNEWEGNYDLVKIIISHTFNKNNRQFRRHGGLELITGFYRSLNRYKPTSEDAIANISNIEELFHTHLKEFLEVPSQFEIKPKFLKTLRKLINIMRQFHQSNKIESNLNFLSMLNDISSIKSVAKNKKKIENASKTINSQTETSKKSKKRRKDKLPQLNGENGVPAKKSKTSGSE